MSAFPIQNLAVTLSWLSWSLFPLFPVATLASPPLVFEQPLPPPVPDPPPTDSGVGRDPCSDSAVPLSAIAPLAMRPEGDETMAWGLTTQALPEFWFYIPYTPEQIESASFKLFDDRGNPIERDVEVTGTPGIVRLVSPIPLASDRWYQAHFSLEFYCNDTSPLETKFVRTNAIKRDLPPTLTEPLEQANTPREKAIFYAQNGFWYDVLSAIAQLESEEATTERDRLFESVGLGAFVSQPMTQCCASNPPSLMK
jgi:hypothetical protein